MDNKTHTWVMAGLAGLLVFLLGAVVETLLNVWALKKFNVCPYMQKKEK